MRHSLFGVAAAALFALMIPAAPASAQGACGIGHPCAGSRAVHAGQAYGRYPRHDYSRGYGRGGDIGVGVAAGVAGLAAAAIIGGAIDQNSGYYPAGEYPAGPYDDYATGPDQGPVYGAPVYGAPVYAAPDPQVADDSDAVAYCERTFRSYDPASGTYLGYDGVRHSCP